MSSEEFWKDDPQLFVSYRTSFINKKKREFEELDYYCWRQGLYIYSGNSSLMAMFRQFVTNVLASMFKGSKDNSKIDTYPSKPFLELEKEEEQRKQQEKRDKMYNDFEKDLYYFGTLKQQYKEKMKKGRK